MLFWDINLLFYLSIVLKCHLKQLIRHDFYNKVNP